MRNYTRWTEATDGPDAAPGRYRQLQADLIGMRFTVTADTTAGVVILHHHDSPMSPDEARMLGVRLIEGAALADGDRAIRRAS